MRTLRVLNLGAGVQSTYLYLQDDIPYDAAIFADTQEEPAAVYHNLAYLESLGRFPILRVSFGSLGEQLIAGRNCHGGRFASIPAFTRSKGDAREGRLRRQCTREAKIDAIVQSIRRDLLGLRPRQRFPVKQVEVVQYLGLSADEVGRASRVLGAWRLKWSRPVFPLIDKGLSRRDCQLWLSANVPHHVERSACVFCPYRRDEEWRDLRDRDPAGWDRAVEIDAALRSDNCRAAKGLERPIYLHRSCVPLPLVDLIEGGQTFLPFASEECTGMCGN
jgi:hypothetical protein